MYVAVLGSVQVLDRHRRDVLAGAGPRQRSLLAALVLATHHTLDTDLLIDWMWGEDLPADPRNALSLHASRLRSTLQRVWGGDRLRREGGRYRLDLEGVDVDLAGFRAGRVRAGELWRDGDEDAALVEAGVALARWAGRPLSGLPDTPSVLAKAAALEEEHLTAQCERTEIALAARSARVVLGELASLVATHPLDERLRALQVRALHAAGRTADALRAYASARRALLDELGVGPGAELQLAQREVLGGPPVVERQDGTPWVARRGRVARSRTEERPELDVLPGVAARPEDSGPDQETAPAPEAGGPGTDRLGTDRVSTDRVRSAAWGAQPVTWSVRPLRTAGRTVAPVYRWPLSMTSQDYPAAG